jgi:rSAM/selenodomain-associated transferase 2
VNLSVIIPTLNEAEHIRSTIDSVRTSGPCHEIIVVDGGSTDETRAIAARRAQVLRADRGRAHQMNAGADAATGDILLFLHADTLLSKPALASARRAIRSGSVCAGTFRLQFQPSTPALRFFAACTRIPWMKLCFGDRGLFTTREAFDAVGGFPKWPVFEDLEMATRLANHGGFAHLSATVTTSARRFQRNGALRQQLHNLRLWLHYVAGTSPASVAHLYRYDEGRG